MKTAKKCMLFFAGVVLGSGFHLATSDLLSGLIAIGLAGVFLVEGWRD